MIILFGFFTASDMAFPACIINGTAVTKTFQILYRNEEVRLDDVIHFKIHAIVEAGKVSILKTFFKITHIGLKKWAKYVSSNKNVRRYCSIPM